MEGGSRRATKLNGGVGWACSLAALQPCMLKFERDFDPFGPNTQALVLHENVHTQVVSYARKQVLKARSRGVQTPASQTHTTSLLAIKIRGNACVCIGLLEEVRCLGRSESNRPNMQGGCACPKLRSVPAPFHWLPGTMSTPSRGTQSTLSSDPSMQGKNAANRFETISGCH
jgi:hypothetical protein